MDDFIKQNVDLVISTLYLVFALLLAGYTIPYKLVQIGRDDLGKVSADIAQENASLKKLKQELLQATERSQLREDIGVKQMPDFLRRINSIANKNDVIIRKLVPDTKNRFKYQIDIITDYRTFLRFTAQLESLNTVVHNLGVRPYKAQSEAGDPPTHLISFSITPRNDAQPLSNERLSALAEDVNQPNLRNPFVRYAWEEGQPVLKAEIDLTWINKLTGISQDNLGAVATIDNASYRVGQTVAGSRRRITQIHSDRVILEQVDADGTQIYVIKFRISK